jgi:uncharacterized membrane protein (UPF0136 family)
MVLGGQIALGIYALLLAVGGVIGYVKAKSRPSLIAGLVSAGVAVASLAWSTRRPVPGFVLGIFLAAALFFLFQARYRKSGKFMPAGLLVVASVAVGLLLLAIILVSA